MDDSRGVAVDHVGMTSVLAATTDHWHHDWGPWVAVVVLFWLALVASVVVLQCTYWRHRAATVGGRRVLAERFARGEIDEAEYESRVRTLRGK